MQYLHTLKTGERVFSLVPSYTPRKYFTRRIKEFDVNLFIIWHEYRQEIQIWCRNVCRNPHQEHAVQRSGYFKELDGVSIFKPEHNWDLEDRCIRELQRARKWQQMTVEEFQADMNAEPAKKFADEEKRQDEEMEDFLSDPYNYEKAKNQMLNNDAEGRVQTKWSGSSVDNPGGKEK